MSYFHAPVADALEGPVGTGAWLLAFALVFGSVFILGKIASRRVGERVRKSVVGPLDRVLGAGFGALKGLIGATVLYLGFSLVYDTIWTPRGGAARNGSPMRAPIPCSKRAARRSSTSSRRGAAQEPARGEPPNAAQ